MKKKINLDLFDVSEYPKDMRIYLKNYGFHFNKRACEEAVKRLWYRNAATGKDELVTPHTKEEVEQMLVKNGVKLENAVLYDHVWVANMLMSDHWKSGIDDELHWCKAIKDMIDDVDQPDGFIFNRWISDRMYAGVPIEWAELL